MGIPTLQLDTCVGQIVPALARDALLPSLVHAMSLNDQMIWSETSSVPAEVRALVPLSGDRKTWQQQIGVTNSSNRLLTNRRFRSVACPWTFSNIVNNISDGKCDSVSVFKPG